VQSAYDTRSPNGSGRRAPFDPVPMIFRLYRLASAATISPVAGSGFLATVRNTIRDARNTVRSLQALLAPVAPLNPLTNRILVREYRFVMILEQIDKLPEVRSSWRYTAGGVHVDLPLQNAKGVTRFRLAGRTHWTPVLVNGIEVDGAAAIKDFAELIEDYFYPPAGEGYPADYLLTWYNYLAPISAEDPFGEFEWVILPHRNGVRQTQTARQPFLWGYQFDFIGLRSNRDLAKAEDGFLAGLFSRGLLGRLLNALGLDALGAALDGIFGALNDFVGLITDLQNLATVVNDYVRGVADFIVYSVARVRALLTAVDQLIATIEEGIELISDIPSLTEEQLSLVRQSYPGLSSGDPEPAIIAAGDARRVRDFLLSLLAQRQSFTAPQSPSALARTMPLRVAPGTTLEQIAAQAGVTPQELIDLNRLQYPFVDARPRPERQITAAEGAAASARARLDLLQHENLVLLANGQPPKDEAIAAAAIAAADAEANEWRAAAAERPGATGVLYAGDVIRIPVAASAQLPSVVGVAGNQVLAADESASVEELLFGRDLYVSDDGNLELDADGQDVVTIAGLENIHGAQVRYVKLPLGALRFAPGIGNYAWDDLSRWQGEGTTRLLAYALWRTLQQDPRVRVVRDVRAVTYAGESAVEYDAELINGEAVPNLRVPVPV